MRKNGARRRNKRLSVTLFETTRPAFMRRACLVSGCESESAFLVLLCKLFFSFFGLNENIVGVAQFFVPSISDLPEAVPIVKFKLMQVFEKVLIDFGLQLLRETGEQLCRFRFEWPGSL